SNLMLAFRQMISMTANEKYGIVYCYRMTRSFLSGIAVCSSLSLAGFASEPQSASAVIKQYCYDCHDADMQKGKLNLEALQGKDIANDPNVWEKVVRKMNARQMPPIGKSRPDENTYEKTIAELAVALDRAAETNPNPGR